MHNFGEIVIEFGELRKNIIKKSYYIKNAWNARAYSFFSYVLKQEIMLSK